MRNRLALSCLCAVLTMSGAHAAPGPARSELVPPGWSVEPVEGRKDIIRYVSPDKEAVLTLQDAPTRGRSLDEEFTSLSRRDGDVTYSRKSRSWFVLSGYRGGEIFYTRVDRACGGRRWHVLELTYPRAAKADLDAAVTRVSRRLGRFQNVCPSEESRRH